MGGGKEKEGREGGGERRGREGEGGGEKEGRAGGRRVHCETLIFVM